MGGNRKNHYKNRGGTEKLITGTGGEIFQKLNQSLGQIPLEGATEKKHRSLPKEERRKWRSQIRGEGGWTRSLRLLDSEIVWGTDKTGGGGRWSSSFLLRARSSAEMN